MSGVLNENDFAVLNDVVDVLKVLGRSKESVKTLELKNRLGGILSEAYAILELHSRYPKYKLEWKPPGAKDVDIALSTPSDETYNIQVKKMTGTFPHNPKHFYFWQTRQKPNVVCPWIFVYMEANLEPTFFCVAKTDMEKFVQRAEEERRATIKCRKAYPNAWRGGKDHLDGGNPELQLSFYLSRKDLEEDWKEWKDPKGKKSDFYKYWPEFYEKKGKKLQTLFANDYKDFKVLFSKP